MILDPTTTRQACVDLPTRYGGDEFMIVLPEASAGEAQVIWDRIEAEIVRASFDGVFRPVPA